MDKAQLKLIATTCKDLLDAFIEVGFTHEEALELVKVSASGRKN